MPGRNVEETIAPLRRGVGTVAALHMAEAGTARRFAHHLDRSKLKALPTSLGIRSWLEIFAVTILDAIGGTSDVRKMWQNGVNDPKETCAAQDCCGAN